MTRPLGIELGAETRRLAHYAASLDAVAWLPRASADAR